MAIFEQMQQVFGEAVATMGQTVIQLLQQQSACLQQQQPLVKTVGSTGGERS